MAVKLEDFKKRVTMVSPSVDIIGEYKGLNKKIKCICKKCGYEWEPFARVLIRSKDGKPKKGGGCPKCANRVKKTHEQFESELKKIKPNIKLLTKYKGANEPIECKCLNCGYEWPSTPHVLLEQTDSMCPNEASNRKLGHDEFVAKLRAISPEIEIRSRYNGAKETIWCYCTLHSVEWPSTPQSLLRGSKCQECNNEKMRQERLKSHQQFVEEAGEKNPYTEIVGEYKGAAKRVACRCKRCGNEWSPLASNVLAGYRCAKCFGNEKKTDKQFKKEAREAGDYWELLEAYVNSKTRILARCKKCGKTKKIHPDSILRGSKCSCYYPQKTSLPEEFLAAAFDFVTKQKSGKMSRHDRTAIGKELDILITDFDDERTIAIEPGQWVLHKKHYESDMEKRERCLAAGIQLLTIYYGVDEEIENTPENVLIFSENIEGFKARKRLAEAAFEYFGIEIEISEAMWRDIEKRAKINASKDNAEKYKKKLAALQPNFELLSEFVNYKTKVKVKCRLCGAIWDDDPYRLLNRKSCKEKCDKIMVVYDQKSFQKAVEKNAPFTELLSPFINMTTKIDCKCKRCGRVTPRLPKFIAAGDACMNCDKRGGGKKDHEIFVRELREVNPKIEVLGEYKGATEKIKVKCLDEKCGHVWRPTPDSLMHGHGCPVCAGNKKKTHEEFVAEMKKINPHLKIVGRYERRRGSLAVECSVCGHEFTRTIETLYKGVECPECRKNKKD